MLRMPSRVHEILLASIASNIVQQLYLIAEEKSPASEFAQRIKQSRSSTVTYSDPAYAINHPDDSFLYLNEEFPNVILEISYSQKRKDVARLADNYILGSDGNICVVVGIDIDYKDKSATLSMWRPQIQVNNAGEEELVAHQTVSNQVCLHLFFVLLGIYSPLTGVPHCKRQSELTNRLTTSAERLCTSRIAPREHKFRQRHLYLKCGFVCISRLCGASWINHQTKGRFWQTPQAWCEEKAFVKLVD